MATHREITDPVLGTVSPIQGAHLFFQTDLGLVSIEAYPLGYELGEPWRAICWCRTGQTTSDHHVLFSEDCYNRDEALRAARQLVAAYRTFTTASA